jgi:hypothetical protein
MPAAMAPSSYRPPRTDLPSVPPPMSSHILRSAFSSGSMKEPRGLVVEEGEHRHDLDGLGFPLGRDRHGVEQAVERIV